MSMAPDPAGPLRVGFVGLGAQGAPMARRILAAGLPLAIWARRPESLAPFAPTAAVAAASLVELGNRSNVVGVCVRTDDDVLEVVLGDDGLLRAMAPGSILLLHSTIHPDTVGTVADAGSALGVDVLDAPVSGGAFVAEKGRLTVMVGGSAAGFERVRPVLESFGTTVRHLGPLGSGALVKLVNNFLFTALLAMSDEALALGAALGADRQALADILVTGSAANPGVAMLRGRPGGLAELRSAAGTLLAKDAELLRRVAAARGVELGAIDLAVTRALAAFG